MAITGSQYQQLQSALLAAFDEPGLRRLVRFELNSDLDHIAGGNDLTERTFNLVKWADDRSCISELIRAARSQNPTSLELKALAKSAKRWHVTPPVPSSEPPYKGLEHYDVADAALFFGRDTLSRELISYLVGHQFLAVIGASGSGKSSIVRAGVIANLKNGVVSESDKWKYFVMTPTSQPLKTLAAVLTQDNDSANAATTLMDDMKSDHRNLDMFAVKLAAKTGVQRLVLIVDQFEEVFTLCKDETERKAFVDNLLFACRKGPTTVVLTLRADFYAHCAQFDELRLALQDHQKYIGRMSLAELRTAIEKPAAKHNWELEPGLTARFLKDITDQPGGLPLLSYALLETWNRRSGRMLTLAGYEASGGVQSAIAKKADEVFDGLLPQQQLLARNVFVRLTALGEGVPDTRRRVSLDELVITGQEQQMEDLLRRLEDARLITAEKQLAEDSVNKQETVFVDVAHDALIHQWPRLRNWLDEDREGLLVHRRLTEASGEWERLNRDPGVLFRGAVLERAAQWDRIHDRELNDHERAFLSASMAQATTERRRTRTLQFGGVALVALVLLTMLFSLSYVSGKNRELDSANATVQANLTLANAQLARQASMKLLQTAVDLAATGNFTDAIATYDKAITADPTLPIDADTAITGTIRATVNTLLRQGEKLLRGSNTLDLPTGITIQPQFLEWARTKATKTVGWSPSMSFARQQALISATALFSQALSLNPPADTPVYVWIEPGEFEMGSTPEQIAKAIKECNELERGGDCQESQFESERPMHTVVLDGYWIQRTEVTNEQYKRCVDAYGCIPPSNAEWNKPRLAGEPVTDLTWYEAYTYTQWVGGRLPTEAEWEFACRGTDGRVFPWGNSVPDSIVANYYPAVGSPHRLVEVASYPPGTNGIYDMVGNAWEWIFDWYGENYYQQSPPRNPTGPPTGDERSIRGGLFGYVSGFSRCSHRLSLAPGTRATRYSFRVVLPGIN